MPHPDYRIVDVPLRLDQVARLMRLMDDAVATGQASTDDLAGPYMAMLYEVPTDSPHLRPGPEHWVMPLISRRKAEAR